MLQNPAAVIPILSILPASDLNLKLNLFRKTARVPALPVHALFHDTAGVMNCPSYDGLAPAGMARGRRRCLCLIFPPAGGKC